MMFVSPRPVPDDAVFSEHLTCTPFQTFADVRSHSCRATGDASIILQLIISFYELDRGTCTAGVLVPVTEGMSNVKCL